MKSFIFGLSTSGMAIPAFQFGDQGPRVLILGGVHGNEPEGVICAHGLLNEFSKNFPFKLRLTLVPSFNIEGVVHSTRVNGRGVDLNRNLPTKDWKVEAFNPKYPPGPKANSEPENQALVKFIDQNPLSFVISLHSFTPMLNVNGNCQPEAGILSQMTGYPIEETVGYPTPGCLGTYTGIERSMPTITYEIERGLSAEKIIKLHVPAILEALKSTQERQSAK